MKKSKAMNKAFSFTHFLSLPGKFVASKDGLLHCWKILGKGKFGHVDADLESMVKHARKLMVSWLRHTSQPQNRIRLADARSSNRHRNREMGLVNLARAFEKARGHIKACSHVLRGGSQGAHSGV